MSDNPYDTIDQQAAEIKRYQEVVFGLSMVLGAITTLALGVAILTYYAYCQI